MTKRTIGNSGPDVFPMGLGCMGMSEFYGPADEEDSIRLIQEAVDLGVSLFDTADMYGAGHNERLLGKALSGRRDRVVIATKFAIQRTKDGGFGGICGRPEYVHQACDASLKRLGVDTIDLYQQHRVDPEVPIEETVGAMGQLVEAGKVRWLGLSEAAPTTIRRAAATHPLATLQTEYSLWSREPESELLPLTRELGMAFIAYSPLGRGFLTGQLRSVEDLAANDFRRHSPRFRGNNFTRNLELADTVHAMAESKGCTAAQLALAWAMVQPNVIPIPGTRKSSRLRENLAAAELELSEAELRRLDEVAPLGWAHGNRYPEGGMRTLDG
jgi:aryl-alcohol dehydrogenase-like predicted oxidoreductase